MFFSGFKISVEQATPSFPSSITGKNKSTEGTCSRDKKEEEAKPEQADGGYKRKKERKKCGTRRSRAALTEAKTESEGERRRDGELRRHATQMID